MQTKEFSGLQCLMSNGSAFPNCPWEVAVVICVSCSVGLYGTGAA